ncbi:MAG: phosphatidylserine/phosphatidylglycerophosphate/cardiolipin synthase family protein [Candidatus Sericytochromatia bacterium]|nr:phosphatidylserine/phosphatidylglycerophosphate/cardiolipin synthase family protein [Candidatus Sericytochromatia bacterium]
MRTFNRIAASFLGLVTTACAVAPVPLMASTNRSADTTAIRSLAVSETSALLKELGVTSGSVSGPAVSLADLQAMDRDGDRKIGRTEIETFYAQTLEQAGATAVAEPLSAPALIGPSRALPKFFVNPTPQGNETKLCVDEAEIFQELFEMLRGAKQSIQMDFYLLGGEIGLSIARVLAQKAAEGVEVRLMMDPKLGLGGPTAVGIARVTQFLKANNVGYKLYPLGLYGTMPNPMQQKFQIDHNKILVVDGNSALMGSMNLDDGARMNHDLMIRISGPTAGEVSRMLDSEWPMGIDPNQPIAPVSGGMRTHAVAASALVRLTQTAPQEKTTKGLLLREIDAAQKSIHLSMYEFGDPDLAAALCQAYKRGVDVRVLMDDKGTMAKYGIGAMPGGMPNIMPARELLKAGAQVRWYDPQRVNQELHMKMVVFDGTKAIAGSTNWTTNALTRWRETSFVVQGQTATQLEQLFQRNWDGNSRRIDTLTLGQRITAKVVDYMNRQNLAFW